MKKILTIGLSYFAEKITSELNKIDAEHSYIMLNTYYKLADKIKLLYLLPFSKTLYSINGTLSKSLAVSYALLLKKRVVMHWVGSDVLAAKNDYLKNRYNSSFINKCLHLTDTPWFVDELAKIGIKAQYLPLMNFSSSYSSYLKESLPQKFKVLIYIHQNNQIFYGLNRIAKIATQLNDIEFHVIGTKEPIVECPSNMFFHGWVKDTENYILDSVVCIRIPEHDGLSFFVLESLYHKRYVLYNCPLPYTDFVLTDEDIIAKLNQYKQLYDSKQLSLNDAASLWVQQQFSEKNIYELKKILTNEQ